MVPTQGQSAGLPEGHIPLIDGDASLKTLGLRRAVAAHSTGPARARLASSGCRLCVIWEWHSDMRMRKHAMRPWRGRGACRRRWKGREGALRPQGTGAEDGCAKG